MGVRCFTPHHLDQALQYLHQYGDETTILAGGTDVLVRHHGRLYELARIMNVCEIEELKCIRVVDDKIELGSLVTHTQLEESMIILNSVPFLAEAAASIGSPQIRNRGTVGGNVVNASPAGDLLPALIALDAQIKFISLDRGEKVMPVEDFLTGPGRNVLKKDEIVTGFSFNIPRENYHGVFQKLGYRKALAISTVNAAVLLGLKGSIVEDARIVLGAVAPTPVRACLAEEMLKGREVTSQVMESVLNQMLLEISPISDIRGSSQYRLDTVKELVKLAITGILHKGGKRK